MAVFLCFLICIQLAAGSSRRNIRILHTRVNAITSPLLCSRPGPFVNSRGRTDRENGKEEGDKPQDMVYNAHSRTKSFLEEECL
jgi:hypothetical protein